MSSRRPGAFRVYLAVATAASIFIVLEGRRLGFRWYRAHVLASFVTAVGFTFPLFLAVRERHLDRLARAEDADAAAAP